MTIQSTTKLCPLVEVQVQCFLIFPHKMEVISFMLRQFYSRGRSSRNHVDKMLGGPIFVPDAILKRRISYPGLIYV
jgi:hypothetical protein